MKEKGVDKCPHCGSENFETMSMRTHVCREKNCGKRFGTGWDEDFNYGEFYNENRHRH